MIIVYDPRNITLEFSENIVFGSEVSVRVIPNDGVIKFKNDGEFVLTFKERKHYLSTPLVRVTDWTRVSDTEIRATVSFDSDALANVLGEKEFVYLMSDLRDVQNNETLGVNHLVKLQGA